MYKTYLRLHDKILMNIKLDSRLRSLYICFEAFWPLSTGFQRRLVEKPHSSFEILVVQYGGPHMLD